jgi:hypothetical protein
MCVIDIETYIDASTDHGNDEGYDTEIGDLQEYLRVAFGLLTEEQRLAFASSTTVKETLSVARGGEEEEDEEGS